MANTSAKYGLKIFGPQIDSPQEYPVDPAATAIYKGDSVKLVADQGVAKDTAGSEASIGVVVGFYDSTGKAVATYPGGSVTGYKAVVLDNPAQKFVIKCDTALTAADIGTCSDLVVGTANTVTNTSGDYLTAVGTGTAQFKIIGLAPFEGNAWGANQDVIVKYNEHMFLKTAGV